MHFSVNQLEQTITLNGHIYMTWVDEMAVWDSSAFNNVRSTVAKQWEVWVPELRVINSASGVNQYFEISKRSHIALNSITPTSTKVEAYPSFAIKIGCSFDYSAYPNDMQRCAMQLQTINPISDVELTIYYQMDPSLMLGWGEQANKRHISDWELLSITSNLTYYRSRNYTSSRPISGRSARITWTIVMVWIELQRNAGLFWCTLALPAFASTLFNLLSFALHPKGYSIMVVTGNFLLQSFYLGSLLKELPPISADGSAPFIARYSSCLLVMTLIALCLHLFFHRLFQQEGGNDNMPSGLLMKYGQSLQPLLVYLTPGGSGKWIASADGEGDGLLEKGVEVEMEAGQLRRGLHNLCSLLYALTVLIILLVLLAI